MNGCIYRPREAEVNPDGVGERTLRDDIWDLEWIGAEDGCHSAAVGARGLWGSVGLIVLETDPEEGLTLALLLERRSQTSFTAVFVTLYSLLVQKLLQLQLKNSRAKPLRRKAAYYHQVHTQYRLCESACCDGRAGEAGGGWWFIVWRENVWFRSLPGTATWTWRQESAGWRAPY